MNKVPHRLWAAFTILFLVLLCGGGWFYRAQEQRLRAEAEEYLQAISHLKVAQISQWRAEHLADANEMLDRPFTRALIARWMVSPQDEDAEQILSWFRSLRKHHKFNDVLLVDAVGRTLLSLSGRRDRLDTEVVQALETALRERRSVLCDLHIGSPDQSPRLEAIAPLFSGEEKNAVPIGAVVQQIDAQQFLYPLIASWPTPSRSAETLLVRRDGDSALFLNALRHRKETALKLRIPLTEKEVPAVMAVLGREGMMDGKDYRGIDVLSALKAVPDSPWFMVAKVDEAEILAGWHLLSYIILALVLGLMTAMASTIGMAWQYYAKAHYRALLESEEALRKSEARYGATVMSIGDGVIATDAEARVELLNPVAETLTGWRQGEARGKPVTEVFRIINEHTRNSVENPVERVLREGVVAGLANHTLLVALDGKEYPIADSGAPILSKDGEITGVVLVFRDQSEERAFLNELRESEEKYRDLYDEAPVGYVELDCEGRIDRVNKKILEMLGYTAMEMLGEPLWNFVVEKKEAEQAIKATLSGKAPPNKALERTYKRRDGAAIPVVLEGKVARDSEGRINGIRTTIQDITERKKAEEELRTHEAQLSKANQIMSGILEHTHMLAALLDTQFNFVWVNRAYAAAGRHDQSFFAGKNHFDLYPHEGNKAIFRKVADTGEPLFITAKPFEYPDRPERGITYWDWSLIPVKDAAGAVTNLVFTLMEVTERVRAQEELRKARDQLESRVRDRTAELERRNRELQEFAFVASHDLNEPLRKIQVFGSLLREKGSGRLSEVENDYISRMTGAANRMQELLDALLRYSRIDTRGCDFIRVQLNKIVHEAAGDLEVAIRSVGVQVEIGSLPIINGDPFQWRQVFQNLIGNAAKYHRSEVKPFIKIYGEEGEGAYTIFVEDNGIGFDEKYLDKIFQPFQRLHGKHEYQGTGIGLAICKKIVERHGGTITAKSTLGKGSTFVITLPTRQAGF